MIFVSSLHRGLEFSRSHPSGIGSYRAPLAFYSEDYEQVKYQI